MKKLAAFWAVLVLCMASVFADAPTVILSGSGAATTTEAALRAYVNANGSNTVYWFKWGASESTLNNVSATNSIGAGTTNVSVSVTASNLVAGGRYYYTVTATNDVGTTTAAVRSFITTDYSYSIGGIALADLDETRPYGSEPGSVWDDALRQTRSWVKNFLSEQHGDSVVHKPGFIGTGMIQDGAVTSNKLSAGVNAAIAASVSNAVATVSLTNSYVYISSYETTNAITANAEATLFMTTSVASNGYSKLMIQADFKAENLSGATTVYTYWLSVAGVPQQSRSVRVRSDTSTAISGTWVVNGGQTTQSAISLLGTASRVDTRCKWYPYNIRITGIP